MEYLRVEYHTHIDLIHRQKPGTHTHAVHKMNTRMHIHTQITYI
jgi:hypothetical protein